MRGTFQLADQQELSENELMRWRWPAGPAGSVSSSHELAGDVQGVGIHVVPERGGERRTTAKKS